MTNQPLRLGIAGTGSIANSFATGVALVDGVELVAVGSRSVATAEAFGTAYEATRFHGSYESLAADPDIDLVYIASPQHRHRDDAVLFCTAGKHVICEKPLALSVAQVDAMIETATSNDVLLMEAMWSRFSPAWIAMKAHVDAGDIGDIVSIHANFGLPRQEPDHRLMRLDLGGGGLLDLGIYPVTLISWLLGHPASVHAVGVVGSTGVDEHVTALMGFASGATATAESSLRTFTGISARINGTDGAIDLPMPFHATDSFTLHRSGQGPETITSDDAQPVGLHHQLAHVRDLLAEGERQSPVISLDESRMIMVTMDEIRRQIGMKYPGE